MTRFLRIALFCVAVSCSILASANENRADHGNSAYPIWSELSFFERNTLSDLPKAKAGNPDALLALYMVASGSRTLSEYENARNEIQRFIKQVHSKIIEKNNDWLVGQILNQEMHAHFFAQETSPHSTSKYSADQSRLSGIFDNNEFNCISASLLYVVLARHFQLSVQGVMLPSHAFIEINLKDGRKIDVETTSPNGYDQIHDEAFYERNGTENQGYMGFAPASYQDYLNRERLSPTLLGARNMLNQHTIPSRMTEEDSSRLAEISAFLDPNNLMAQEKRLYFYNREIHILLAQQNWGALQRLFATTYNSVMTDLQKHASVERLQNALNMYLAGAMLTYAQLGEIDNTLGVMGEILKRGLDRSDDQNQLESRVINAISILISRLADQKRFQDGLLVLSLMEGHLSDPKAWPDMVSWFYLKWAHHEWDKSNWPEVITITQEYMSQTQPGSHQNQILEVASSTYYNWTLQLLDANDGRQANQVHQECLSYFPLHVCKKTEELIRDFHLKKRKTI